MAAREVIQVEQRVPILKGIPLSLQHLFAMFGASILVPVLFNQAAGKTVVDPALVLMMNGIGTLVYIVEEWYRPSSGLVLHSYRLP